MCGKLCHKSFCPLNCIWNIARTKWSRLRALLANNKKKLLKKHFYLKKLQFSFRLKRVPLSLCRSYRSVSGTVCGNTSTRETHRYLHSCASTSHWNETGRGSSYFLLPVRVGGMFCGVVRCVLVSQLTRDFCCSTLLTWVMACGKGNC